MIPCELFQRHVGAFVDGELDPATHIEFEEHVAGCRSCRESLDFEGSYRSIVAEAMEAPAAPESLRERVLISLDAEPEPERAAVRMTPLPLRYALPIGAAAAVALTVGALNLRGADEVEEASVASLEDVVRLHSSRLPADVSLQQKEGEGTPGGDQAVSSWFRDKVEFPVRPAEFARRDVRLVGARLSNVRERRAAALYSELQGGRRLTVVVTDANVAEGDEAQLGNAQVITRDVRGYAVPVRREAGLTYAFTGDVDRDTLMRLAASARVRY